MARKRKRSIDWARVLWLLLLLNLGIAYWFSPITSLTRVRTTGVRAEDREWVRSVLQEMKDKPYGRSDRDRAVGRLLQASHIDGAELRANLFGSGLLKLRYHEPVARFEAADNAYLSERGVVFTSPHLFEDLPLLRLPDAALAPSLAIIQGWPSERAAWLLDNLPGSIPPQGTLLEVESNGGLCIHTSSGGRIRLGDGENLEEKLQVVQRLLEQQPDLLAKVEELNVTSPQRPVRTPRTGGTR